MRTLPEAGKDLLERIRRKGLGAHTGPEAVSFLTSPAGKIGNSWILFRFLGKVLLSNGEMPDLTLILGTPKKSAKQDKKGNKSL